MALASLYNVSPQNLVKESSESSFLLYNYKGASAAKETLLVKVNPSENSLFGIHQRLTRLVSAVRIWHIQGKASALESFLR